VYLTLIAAYLVNVVNILYGPLKNAGADVRVVDDAPSLQGIGFFPLSNTTQTLSNVKNSIHVAFEQLSHKSSIRDERLEKLEAELEKVSLRYWMYDDARVTLPQARAKQRDPTAKPIDIQTWLKRQKEFSSWDLMHIETFEAHPLRTYDIAQADFVIVPIPVGPCSIYLGAEGCAGAFRFLRNHTVFLEHRSKHVYLTSMPYAFLPDKAQMYMNYLRILPHHVERFLENTTIVKTTDVHQWYSKKDHGDFKKREKPPYSRKGWSMSFAGAASTKHLELRSVSYEDWTNRSIHFFYHTRTTTSLNNSTRFRWAPCQDETRSRLPSPSSVGYTILRQQWKSDFANAKFCLAIRGDNPNSRSIFPAASLIQATSLSEKELRRKLDGLALVQRMLIVDHPNSLFVQSFLRETQASQQDSYYDFKGAEFD